MSYKINISSQPAYLLLQKIYEGQKQHLGQKYYFLSMTSYQ